MPQGAGLAAGASPSALPSAFSVRPIAWAKPEDRRISDSRMIAGFEEAIFGARGGVVSADAVFAGRLERWAFEKDFCHYQT